MLYEPPIAVPAKRLAGLDELVAEGDQGEALEAFLGSAGAPPEQLAAIRSSPAWPILLEAVPALPRELHAAAAWRHPRGPIDVPALFLHGADTRAASTSTAWKRSRPRFRTIAASSIPGQQHIAHVFAAEAVAARVADFLR